ncbi:MAG TPA: hypothetical protein DDZ38_08990, partial [Gammaproteobacteria bacterium]|nr:hypothetical protein [Gammaproteobacteria bacterium]
DKEGLDKAGLDEEGSGSDKPNRGQKMREIDQEKLGAFIKQTGGMVAAGFNCVTSVLGDRLGLFSELADLGPSSSEALAASLGLHERWVREWLHQQVCIGQVDYDAQTQHFSLSPEAQAVLVDQDHPAFLMGAYDSAVAVVPAMEKLETAFRTGIGMDYDEHGASCACGIERMGAFTKRHRLVPEILPLLPSMEEKLFRGAQVADVGCGGALSTIAMAQAFPRSEFVGYDTSSHALARARANIAEAGVENVRLSDPLQEPLPEYPFFDLITTFDVIHDTPYPARLMQDIHRALKDDGYWLCEDIKGFESFDENRLHHPIAALLYGFSVTICMSAGLSEADGAGLGTLGFTKDLAQKMGQAAGFSGFQQLALDNPMNNYYTFSR